MHVGGFVSSVAMGGKVVRLFLPAIVSVPRETSLSQAHYLSLYIFIRQQKRRRRNLASQLSTKAHVRYVNASGTQVRSTPPHARNDPRVAAGQGRPAVLHVVLSLFVRLRINHWFCVRPLAAYS